MDFIDDSHPLVLLEKKLDWKGSERQFNQLYANADGQSPLPIRLVLGLLMLKSMDNLSDEAVVLKFVENRYYQHFCGNIYFEHTLPCHPTSLTRWRGRIGYKGFEKLLKEP